MTLVSASSAKAARKSVSSRSALLPMLISFASPILRAAGPVEDGRAQRARLREHGDAARLRHVAGEGGVHLVVGVDEAQAVRAHQAGARGTAEIGDLALQPGALLVHLLEAGRDDDDGLGAGLAAS